MLTLLGVIGAGMSFCGYWLSYRGEALLSLAVVGIVINWLGDSLDGSLARYRKAERAKYGFFLDHMTDTLSMALIGVGIGLSPYVHLATALTVLIVYYLMVILSLTTCLATGNFRISFNRLGPTEMRLFLIAFTLAAMILPVTAFACGSVTVTIYDVVMLLLALLMFLTGAIQAIRTARELCVSDPLSQPLNTTPLGRDLQC